MDLFHHSTSFETNSISTFKYCKPSDVTFLYVILGLLFSILARSITNLSHFLTVAFEAQHGHDKTILVAIYII